MLSETAEGNANMTFPEHSLAPFYYRMSTAFSRRAPVQMTDITFAEYHFCRGTTRKLFC
jgi:hypothetical protein